MITALTELCHRVLPGMRGRGWGRIINLSSLAAFSPPGASLLYTGIKSYVLGMSQSMDMELKPQGIHVTALCPGIRPVPVGADRILTVLARLQYPRQRQIVRDRKEAKDVRGSNLVPRESTHLKLVCPSQRMELAIRNAQQPFLG